MILVTLKAGHPSRDRSCWQGDSRPDPCSKRRARGQPLLIPTTESSGSPDSPHYIPPRGPSRVPVGRPRVPQPGGTYLILRDEAIGLHWFLPLQKYHVLQRGEGEGLGGDATGHWGRKGDVFGCGKKPGWKEKSCGKRLPAAATEPPRPLCHVTQLRHRSPAHGPQGDAPQGNDIPTVLPALR